MAPSIVESVRSRGLTRRSFVSGVAAGMAGLALAQGAHGLENTVEPVDDEAWRAGALEGGEWKCAGCWLTCHCGCKNMAYVVDGCVVRQKTDDAHPDTLETPQQRGCVKGRSLRQFVTGADRVRYPMKRKHWAPDGQGDATLRGRDEWERISWDEALDLVAHEIDRVKETYGNLALGCLSLYPASLLAAYGGYTSWWGQHSKGGWPLVANSVKGSFYSATNDRFSLLEAKLVVLWGFNPIWGAGGSNTHYIQQARERGARVIVVDSWLNTSAQALGAEWVPCRPATDGALLAACAYHMIENDLQDQDFLDTYCVGFDAEHMPEGEDPAGNFKDYILGTYDGQPKTPEWASEICGTAPETIRMLAEAMATTKPMTLKAGQGPARTGNGDEFAHMFYAVGWMTGNVGRLGAEVACADGSKGANGGANIVALGTGTDNLTKGAPNVGCTGPRGDGKLETGEYDPEKYYGIPTSVWWQSIRDGKHVDFERGEHDVNIKLLFKIGLGAKFSQNSDQATAVEVLRTPGLIDTFVNSEIVMSPDAQYADIVLPCTSRWEAEGGYTRSLNRENILFSEQLIDPLYEAKSDLWINVELAKRLGVDYSSFCTGDPAVHGYLALANSTILDPQTKEKEPLFSVTEADIEKYGLPMEPQEGRVPFEQGVRDGGYQVERSEGDAYTFVAMKSFVDDPEANPLPTATGKLEIFSRKLVENFEVYHTTPVTPIPTYVPSIEGYEEACANRERDGLDGCVFQLITLHHARQAHTASAEVKSLNEIFANHVLINTLDAEALGVSSEDTVLLSNPHGKSLRRALVTPRVMPGVVIVGQGNWLRLNEQTGIDEGCSVNWLTGGYLTGQGQCQFNSVLLRVQKWDGDPLGQDYLRPPVTVEL